eukprot:gnl/TRDRNA2_/TRDRNA2_183678_c0_seq1.p1 gnl/TRDRNA2_/TRDRNA2_183678_c0~~gnl/TRDRNA2_/TRDRNA2_183678_c0_seq1.p1  ORF type:complete len:788 (+),score=183.38 gnl/TRDRNA2_/TRDRNA2_183678_c0_seq1:174-2537(+)
MTQWMMGSTPLMMSHKARNQSATLAFHQHKRGTDVKTDEQDERQDIVKVIIIEEDNSDIAEGLNNVFKAKLALEFSSSFAIIGPERDTREEAILDGGELGKMYVAEGAQSAREMAKKLIKKEWTKKEREEADEKDLSSFRLSGQEPVTIQPKLIPPGEGWVRFDEDKLVDPRSQIYFVQAGKRAGQYLRRQGGDTWEKVDAPNVPQEFPVAINAVSSSVVRKGAKLDRAVILPDITKIARLALKFPLSFVDLPACAYALFQGLRSAESAQFCAENFHKKLLPMLAEKIHKYETEELEAVLGKALEALDADLLKSTHAFSGVSALVGLVLGNRIVLAGVGRVRAVLIPEKGPPRPVLTCTGDPGSSGETERIRKATGLIRGGTISLTGDDLNEAERILCAHNDFDVLQIEVGGPTDEKQIRTAYRKLALRVHPDKQAADVDTGPFQAAFARLDNAQESVQTWLLEDPKACQELRRVLSSEVHTRAGAAALLGVDATAMVDTEVITAEAEKACRWLVKGLEKMAKFTEIYDRGVGLCKEAVATIQRGCTPEALPRQEALLAEGLTTSRAMGSRDLRFPYPIVTMQPETASALIPGNSRCRLGLLCGPTAELADGRLAELVAHLARQPKASALRWCQDAEATAASTSAVCVRLDTALQADTSPAAKKQKVSGGPEGTVRIRHILIKHKMLKPDPMARREGTAKNIMEAETNALAALEKLLKEPKDFGKLCRELSDCASATQPGQLCGDLGWLARGQQEACIDDVAFSLKANEFGDLVTSIRGVHIIQRLA